MAGLLGLPVVYPRQLRRNLVWGINLLALKGARVRLGEALPEITGACHSRSRVEENLELGGYNTMRGHGGVNARILEGGWMRADDALRVESAPEPVKEEGD